MAPSLSTVQGSTICSFFSFPSLTSSKLCIAIGSVTVGPVRTGGVFVGRAREELSPSLDCDLVGVRGAGGTSFADEKTENFLVLTSDVILML